MPTGRQDRSSGMTSWSSKSRRRLRVRVRRIAGPRRKPRCAPGRCRKTRRHRPSPRLPGKSPGRKGRVEARVQIDRAWHRQVELVPLSRHPGKKGPATSSPPVALPERDPPHTHEATMTMLQHTISWWILSATALLPGMVSSTAAAAKADDDDAAAAAKTEELLKAMTLDEKVGQTTQVDLKAIKDKADIARYDLGSILSGGDSDPDDITAQGWARTHDELQSWALKSRLKIPLIYGIDAVHGHNNVDGAVVFPHNIGLGAMRDPGLVEKAARITALELAGTGIRWAFAPCLAVARDERWGRTYESFGEDPALAETLGAAAVRGLQGSSLAGPTSVLACAKHFLGDGGTTGGIDQGNTQCDLATLRKLHLPGYISATSAGVETVMASYSSWNGKKMHGNGDLLSGLLKNKLGFRGFIVSDWAAIDQLSSDYKAAIQASINAGIDMVMIPNGPGKRNNYDPGVDRRL